MEAPGDTLLAQARFERIEVKGFREATLRLADALLAHGFGAVFWRGSEYA
jgi:hypothetical protein